METYDRISFSWLRLCYMAEVTKKGRLSSVDLTLKGTGLFLVRNIQNMRGIWCEKFSFVGIQREKCCITGNVGTSRSWKQPPFNSWQWDETSVLQFKELHLANILNDHGSGFLHRTSRYEYRLNSWMWDPELKTQSILDFCL